LICWEFDGPIVYWNRGAEQLYGIPSGQVVGRVPTLLAPRPEDWLGSLAGTGRIAGDIIRPASDEGDWEVLRS